MPLLAVVLVLVLIIIAKLADFSDKRGYLQTGGSQDSSKVTLAKMTRMDRCALREITSEEETMKSVGDGRTWPRKKVDRFIEYEDKASPEDQFKYWGIKSDGRLVGVVGIHPVKYGRPETENKLFLTIFVSQKHTGKGIGTKAVKKALKRFWVDRPGVPVYADVLENNTFSKKMLEKVGFETVGPTKIKDKEYSRYLKNTSYSPAA